MQVFARAKNIYYKLVTHKDFHPANATFVKNINMLGSLVIDVKIHEYLNT